VSGESDRLKVIIHAVSLFIFAVSIVFYCGFAALHSVARVESARDRMAWITLTVGGNVLGSLLYYLTKYQDFRCHGLGGLPRGLKSDHPFHRARPSELHAEQNEDAKASPRIS